MGAPIFSYIHPQSLRDSPWGHGERFPRTPSVASLRVPFSGHWACRSDNGSTVSP